MRSLWLLLPLIAAVQTSNADWGPGYQTTPIGSNDDVARAAVIQSDGRLILAGRTFDGTYNSFALARYWPDGSLDSTFDTDGKIITPIHLYQTAPESFAWAHDVAVDSQGRIIAGGRSWAMNSESGGFGYDMVAVRYTSNGVLDTSFHTDGIVSIDFGNRTADFGRAIAVQSDDKIIIGGYSLNTVGNYDFSIAKLTASGDLDSNFHTDGRAITPIGTAGDIATSMTLSFSNDEIALAGYADNGTNEEFAFVQYLSDGTLDTNVDGDGIVFTTLGLGDSRVYGVTQKLSNGKYNLTGRSHNGTNFDVHTARIDDADGGVENNAAIAVGSGAEISMAVEIESIDSTHLAAGRTFNGSNYDFFAMRYQNNSFALQASFETDGIAILAIGSGHDNARDVANIDEGVYVVGDSDVGGHTDFAVVRFQSDGSLAIAGDADVGFNATGSRTTSLGSDDDARAVAQDGSGAFVFAGFAEINGTADANRDFAVVKVLSNGTLDATFGTGAGTHTVSIDTAFQDEGRALAVDGNGRIVVVGFDEPGGTADAQRYAILALNPDGTPDTGFNGGNPVTGQFQNNDQSQAYGVAIDTGNKIVIAGLAEFSNARSQDFGFARYNNNGTLDATFGGGVVIADFGNRQAQARALAMDSQGRFIAAGFSEVGGNQNSTRDFALARVTQAGVLDNTFDTDGLVVLDMLGDQDHANGVAIDTEGRIIAVGFALNGNNEIAIARFQDDGTADPNFDTDGRVVLDIGASTNDVLNGVTIQPNGKILAIGTSNNDIVYVRIDPDGVLDTSFDTDGILLVDTGATENGNGIDILPNGKYIAAGTLGADWYMLQMWP